MRQLKCKLVSEMKYIRKIPRAEEITEKYAITREQKIKREQRIEEIRDILSGKSKKKLICIGPCSADREDAILEYCLRLAKLQDKVYDKFLFIPRVYTSKPRTSGTGYKGILHRPIPECQSDNLIAGIIAVRNMHLQVIRQTGLFPADEMLYPETTYYFIDLLAYVTIGARSVEDQGHRLTASGLELPVGLKNPMSGDLATLLNSISATQFPQSMIYRGWEVETEGNPYTHAILRGYLDSSGKMCPNYHYENLCEFFDRYQKVNLKNMAVLVDCNHCNSRKRFAEQIRIAKEIHNICSTNNTLKQFVKGLMIESYIQDGSQMVGEGIYGKSITDACLGWDKTEHLVLDLYNSD